MEATPASHPSAPTSPARRKRPHPAKQARQTAAAISVGSFLTITGALAVQAATSSSAPGSTTVATTSSNPASTAAATASSDDTSGWSATASTDNSTGTSTAATTPATTQSHGS